MNTTLIQAHLAHIMAGDQTMATHATDALLAELRGASRCPRTLEALGRQVLDMIVQDLKGGIRAQKAVRVAQGDRHGD